ncbi:hypothetical protein DF182_17960 [Chitinophaga flava]|uniref:Uncharacterized protein n=1 Tax=Chitinophaga flava TaxID=2259036 RepID=A0A365XRW5_9BACT|nr:hypothetical protein DF182_17960 [Chitinophaga flava]
MKESAKLIDFFKSQNLFFSLLQIFKNLSVSLKTPYHKELCYLLPTLFLNRDGKGSKEIDISKIILKNY